jgi:hypothetical protein
VPQPPRSTVAQHARLLPPLPALAIVLACAAATGGCSRDAAAGPDDGGADAGAPAGCRTALACDGTKVVSCVDGQPAGVVQDCADTDQVCSIGRCTTRACQSEEQSAAPTFVGCLFYTLHVDNVTSDATAPSSVLVTNPGATVATVELRQRSETDHQWTMIGLQAVAPYQATRVLLPASRSRGAVNFTDDGALQLSSNTPVSAAHFQSDDATESASSSGGTQLLPAHVLGLHYMIMTYPQTNTPRVAQTAGSRDGAGQLIIVGTQDNTRVTFTLSNTASLDVAGGTPPLAPGGTTTLTLGDGDMYQIFSINDGDDLSGSRIDADHPVAVFSGNISTTYGISAMGINSPDMTHEQMLPISLWGLEAVAAQLEPQANTCDRILPAVDGSLYRVLAAQDHTQVSFDGPPGLTGLPAAPIMLDAGQVIELVVSGGSFRVTSNKPVMATQGIDCEPTLSTAVPTAELLTDLRFAVLPHFDQMIAVVRHTGVPLQLDEAPVDDSTFRAAGGDYEVAQITLPPCPLTDGVCVHHLAGEFGVTLRGMDVVASYALTVPTWICAPDVPGCVD